MHFASLSFYLFLAVVFSVYRCCPAGWRANVLLAASLFFYATFSIPFFVLLLLLIALNFYVGNGIARHRFDPFGKYLLWVGCVANLLPLLLFKKLFPTFGSIEASLQSFAASLVVPLGISFYTFHSLSYLIDIYRGKIEPEKKFTFLALYILFFPQLIAGPIMRGNELLPQFHHSRLPGWAEIEVSLRRIYFGLFKKIVVANGIFIFLQVFFATPAGFSGTIAVFAIIFARYYIFADFSGYTDIAIGSAGLFGVKFVENFRRPFASHSIREYWQRWHISLSAWMRDYVYYPLLVTRLSVLGPYPLLVLTFATIGLWHGFTWNFVLYGAWNGLMLAAYDLFTKKRKQSGRFGALKIAGTFFLCVCPPTVLFITEDLESALLIYRKILTVTLAWDQIAGLTALFGGNFAKVLVGILVIEGVQFLQARKWDELFWKRMRVFRPVVYVAFALALLLLGDFTRHDFVYFRF